MQHPEDPIIIPSGAQNVHFEGELVLVIWSLVGKQRTFRYLRWNRQFLELPVAMMLATGIGNGGPIRIYSGGEQKDLTPLSLLAP